MFWRSPPLPPYWSHLLSTKQVKYAHVMSSLRNALDTEVTYFLQKKKEDLYLILSLFYNMLNNHDKDK